MFGRIVQNFPSLPNKERTDAAHVAVSYAAPGGQPGVADRAREDLLARACRSALLTALHPRTAVNVSLQVLEEGDVDEDGEAMCGLAACVNAASLALTDAAVDMRFLLGAVAAGVDAETGRVLVGLEEGRKSFKCACVVTFVFESAKRDVVLTRVEKGKCSEKSFQEMLAAAREASTHLFEFYRSAIKKKFSKE